MTLLTAKDRTIRLAVLAGGCVAGAFLLFWPFPAKPWFLPGGSCLFHQVTGFPCAFCGGTRAAKCLLHQDWAGAWHYNGMACLVGAGGVLAALFLLGEAVSGRRLLPQPSRRTLMAVCIAGLVILACWWAWHIRDALVTPKPELVNFSHPIVRIFVGGPPR